MNCSLAKLRGLKLWVSATRPRYWRALAAGVAPAIEHRVVLRHLAVDGIIDVGANRGQFALMCRFLLPEVPIFAFEPIPKEAAIFQHIHGHSPRIRLIQAALGNTAGMATLHLSKRLDSSSLLPIGRRQAELFKNTAEIGTITVPVHRLDDFVECRSGRAHQLLKLDVQGFELNVLRGAIETLKACSYVYAECSEVALYEGQPLRIEIEAFLLAHGFSIQGRFNEQVSDGQLIQADYLFCGARSGDKPATRPNDS